MIWNFILNYLHKIQNITSLALVNFRHVWSEKNWVHAYRSVELGLTNASGKIDKTSGLKKSWPIKSLLYNFHNALNNPWRHFEDDRMNLTNLECGL